MTRRTIICAMAISLTAATGCGSRLVVTAAPPTSQPAKAVGPLLLAQFDQGVGAVSAGATDPVWTDPDAVAALDGSAVFSVRHSSVDADQLARIDPDTGAAKSLWPLPEGVVSVSAVAPGGRWVALTDRAPGYGAPQARTSTELVVFDATTGLETHRLSFSGDLQPEAFSVDGQMVFALDYHGDHYRVQTIYLPTGERDDTSNRDKTVDREDMHGTSVRGVLNADHTLLATLYRNPGDADEPAFVHILDLEHGWAYCADLPPPFGTGPEGTDLISLTAADTVIVTATAASRIAEIHIGEVHEPSNTPVTVDYRDSPAPTSAASPSAFSATPGFGHVIATLR